MTADRIQFEENAMKNRAHHATGAPAWMGTPGTPLTSASAAPASEGANISELAAA